MPGSSSYRWKLDITRFSCSYSRQRCTIQSAQTAQTLQSSLFMSGKVPKLVNPRKAAEKIRILNSLWTITCILYWENSILLRRIYGIGWWWGVCDQMISSSDFPLGTDVRYRNIWNFLVQSMLYHRFLSVKFYKKKFYNAFLKIRKFACVFLILIYRTDFFQNANFLAISYDYNIICLFSLEEK